jgi:hypothetical protein
MTGDPLLGFRPEFPILEELDRAFEATDEIRATRTWELWTDGPIVVT